MKTQTPKFLDQWQALNKMLFIYKALSLSLVGLAFLLALMVFSLMGQDEVVSVEISGKKLFFKGIKTELKTTPQDIEDFVRLFVEQCYSWDELKPEAIVSKISYLSTLEFQNKFKRYLEKQNIKGPKKKKISQTVTGIQVEVSDKAIIAHFDKVIRIDGIPLVAPSRISLTLRKGAVTPANPYGLYIHRLVEHE